MTTFLQSVDSWFLILTVTVLGIYSTWSIRNLFAELKESIKDLKDTIKELFEHRNDHENRIKVLETRCKLLCGDKVAQNE